jgi:branched-chain amino acid transport system substrate-binding protein
VALFDRFPLFAPGLLGGLVVLAAGCGGADLAPVRIGVAGPFSDPIGLPMKLAAELAAEEINAAGGIGGRRLELVTRDDYADPDSAVFIATDLYDSGVSAVIGHLFSGMSLAAAPVYNGGNEPVVAISPSSSSPELSTAGDYTFRVCPSDLAHGAALAHWIAERLRLRRGAVLYLNDQYGRGVRQTFVREFLRLGGELESVDPYLGSTPEVDAYLDRLARSRRAEFLVVAGNRSEAEEILRRARGRGLAIPVLGGDGLEGIHEAGALAEGVYLSSSYFPTLATESNRRFVEAYARRYGGSIPNQPAAAAYDAVYLLRDVIARSGTDREAVRRTLAAVGSATPPFEGVTGTVAFDAAGDVPNQNVYIGQVRRGEVIVAEDATETVARVP